jgi:hypothetical protein
MEGSVGHTAGGDIVTGLGFFSLRLEFLNPFFDRWDWGG